MADDGVFDGPGDLGGGCAVHLGEANWVAALQLMVLGLVLAAVYERTNSLWANIAIHMFNNAIAFTLLVST